MNDTKERILLTALRLFARDGYEAVSVSDIAGALGMTKGALYRHYPSKRAIFDSILLRMEQRDVEQARQYDVPETEPDGEQSASPGDIAAFSRAMFRYWTEDDFAASFRRLLTLEQFHSAEMGKLYQQYLAAGPMDYLTGLFTALGLPDPRKRAAAYYGPMFLLYSVYDQAEDRAAILALADECLKTIVEERKREEST